MKRPKSIEGRIRYYGIAMAEVLVQAHKAGIQMRYECSAKHLTVEVWFFDTEKPVVHIASLELTSDLDRFEANLEAEMIKRGAEVLS